MTALQYSGAMWGATLADLRFRYRQFVIAVVGAGLVLAMALLLTGLAAGFKVEIRRTVLAVGADRLVMTTSSGGRFTSTSLFPQADVARIAGLPGVSGVGPLAVIPSQQASRDGEGRSVILIGVAVHGLGSPSVSHGSGLNGTGEVVTSSTLGARVGSSMGIDGRSFRVVGTVGDRTLLGGVPVVYLPLQDVQTIALNGKPLVTAVAVRGVPAAVPAGLQAMTNADVVDQTLAMLAGGVSSIKNSRLLMWGVAAMIVAALLYVSALQRRQDFAVFKALGSSSSLLFASLALQSVVVTLAAAVFGAIVCNFMHGLFAQPVAIPASAFVTLPLVAIAVGLLASLVALRTATRADPASAFGG
jgi:putative ABC transport system permease protein